MEKVRVLLERGRGAVATAEAPESEPEASRNPAGTRRAPGTLGRAMWSAALILLALVGLADTLVTQVVFSAYGVSGGGASQVAAPPMLVAVSLVASALVGLLLAIDERWEIHWGAGLHRARQGARRGLIKRLRASIARCGAVWRTWRCRTVATGAALRAALVSVRREGISLPRRGWIAVWLTALALGMSLAADLGAVTPASRPAAQWAWVVSVALLVAAAGVWEMQRGGRSGQFEDATMSRAPHREGHGGEARGRQEDAGEGRAGWQVRLAKVWQRWGDWMLVGVLLAGALALRLPDLTGLPYVVHGDEAWNGLEALRWLSGGVPSLLSTGWYGLPVAGYGLPALVMHFAGANLWGLRLSSVLIGALSIALLYALAREFTSRRVAFLAAGLMTVSHVHIQFSRMGIHYIHGMTVVLLVLWLLTRALRRGSAVMAVLAGAGMSLSLQVYFSARIVFVIVPLFLVGLLLLANRRSAASGEWRGQASAAARSETARWAVAPRRWAKTVGWLALGMIVAIGPLAVYFQQDVGALTGRPAEVLILNLTAYRQQTLHAQFGTTDLRTILGRQLAAVPLLPGGLADTSLQYGPHYAMLDPLVAALVLIGFWYAVCTLRRPLSLLLVLWVVGVVTLGGVLTIDMPWWPRLLAMLPALCLLAALALDRLLGMAGRVAESWVDLARTRQVYWQWTRWVARRGWMPSGARRRGGGWIARAALSAAVVLGVVGFSLAQTIQHYYRDYPRSVNTDTYRTRYTDLAYLGELVPSWEHVILYDSGDLLLDYSTVQFLAPSLRGTKVRTTAALQLALAERSGPVVVIVSETDVPSFQQLLKDHGALPAGSLQEVRDGFGVVAFTIYTIP